LYLVTNEINLAIYTIYSGDETMSKFINMKTIGMTAVSVSLLLGTFAAPASAFAKAAFNRDRSGGARETVLIGRRTVNLKSEGGRVLFRFLLTRNNGNRSVTLKRIL
jgi:hypothetical protein